jgi:hypothetical protein
MHKQQLPFINSSASSDEECGNLFQVFPSSISEVIPPRFVNKEKAEPKNMAPLQ